MLLSRWLFPYTRNQELIQGISCWKWFMGWCTSVHFKYDISHGLVPWKMVWLTHSHCGKKYTYVPCRKDNLCYSVKILNSGQRKLVMRLLSLPFTDHWLSSEARYPASITAAVQWSINWIWWGMITRAAPLLTDIWCAAAFEVLFKMGKREI